MQSMTPQERQKYMNKRKNIMNNCCQCGNSGMMNNQNMMYNLGFMHGQNMMYNHMMSNSGMMG